MRKILAFALGLTTLGCGSGTARLGHTLGEADHTAGGTPAKAAQDFRATFAALAGGDVRYLTFPVAERLFAAPDAGSAGDFFAALKTTFGAESPGRLLAGAELPEPTSTEPVLTALAARPVTIVVVPGFGSELIKARPFEEVFAQAHSAFGDEWAAAVEAQAGTPVAVDRHYDLTSLGEVECPLSDVVTAASIDSADGKPLVKLLLLSHPYMSLESVGNPELAAENLARRLSKAVELVGLQAPVAVLGYSRGAMLALDLVAGMQDQPWRSEIKAVVGLGGVTYGSDTADDVDRPGTGVAQKVALFQELHDNLSPVDGLSVAEKVLQIGRNTEAWAKFLAGMTASSVSSVALPVQMMLETDPGSAFNLAGRLWDSFGLSHPVADYSDNIRRFKFFVEAVLDGARSMTTAARAAWWGTHVVPADGVTYFSLTASMADPAAGAVEQAFYSNPTTFTPDSPDDRFLLSGYQGLVQDSGGITLNDSQMVPEKSRFWGEAAPLLNPAQPPFKAVWLGILGTHHWGLALPYVNKPASGAANRFPRKAMLEALAAQILGAD